MTRYVRIFTTAPIDYDYGWTRGSSVVGTFDQGAKGLAEVRQVFVEESRAEMQRARYASGIYPSWSEEQAAREERYSYLKLEVGI